MRRLIILAVLLVPAPLPAAAVVGVLDAHGDHRAPAVVLDGAGGAIMATRIGEPGEPARALSVVDRPGSLARWSAPTRMAAPGVLEHRVARNRRGDLALAWRAGGTLRLARRRAGARRWTAPTTVVAAGAGSLVSLGLDPRGRVVLHWRDPAGLRSYGTSPASALRLSSADAVHGIVAPSGRSVVVWRIAGDGSLHAAAREVGAPVWQVTTLGAADVAPPRLAANRRGVVAVGWVDASGRGRVALQAPGGPWTARRGARAERIEALQVGPRAAVLASWSGGDPAGGLYRRALGGWSETLRQWGRGFLSHRAAVFVDAAAAWRRAGLGTGPGAARLDPIDVDHRGEVSALLRDGGDLALVRHAPGARTPWRRAAVAGATPDAPAVAANARGDVVVAFLSPSEFVSGDRNAAVLTDAPRVSLSAPFGVRARGAYRLRMTLPVSGRVAVWVGRPGTRPVRVRELGMRRGGRSLWLRAPRRDGVYRVRVVVTSAAGYRYGAGRSLRVVSRPPA